MDAINGAWRGTRRRIIASLAGSATSVILAAHRRGSAQSAPPMSPSGITQAPSSTSIPDRPTASSTERAGASVPGAPRVFISPLDGAWFYSFGPWARLPHLGWPTDRMVAVMSDTWIRRSQVLRSGVGRRCAINTDSPFATLLAERDGQTFSVSLNGAAPVRLGPLPKGGSPVEVPLYDNYLGTTRIELVFDETGANDGLYIAAGSQVSAISSAEKMAHRLVVIGNGYAQGIGASAPGVTGCAALLSDRLKIESINQGWDGTDVDVRRTEQGNLSQNSGRDRISTDVVTLAPHAVLLIYGLDAALTAAMPTWQYAYDYAITLRAIRTALPDVPIFCSGIPSCNGAVSETFLQAWNDAIRSATSTIDNCAFIDAAGWWGPQNYYDGDGPVYVTADNIHPNDDGHRFLADKYAGVLAERLQ